MSTIYIFDIDRTIANNDEREKLLVEHCVHCAQSVAGGLCYRCGKRNVYVPASAWDLFMDPAGFRNDVPYPSAVGLLDLLRSQGAQIHYITGRNDGGRVETEEWLRIHAGRVETEELVMRPELGFNFEHEPASIYKERAFLYLKGKYSLPGDTFVFFDDDEYVLNMYKHYGITFKCPDVWSLINVYGKDRSEEPNLTK